MNARTIWTIDRDFPGKGMPTGGEVHPDLIRFQDHWYCGFKESGRSRLIRSQDGKTWETVKVFDWDGVRVGRPYLSLTAEGLLMVNSWVAPYGASGERRTNQSASRIPRQYSVTWLSTDGVTWSGVHAAPLRLYFSTTWYDGVGYHFGYDGHLYFTLDGRRWEVLAENQFPDREAVLSYDPHDLATKPGTRVVSCSEAALAFDPQDGTAYALLRTNPICAMVGRASAPHYDDWSWQPARVDWQRDGNLVPAEQVMGVQLGGPLLKHLSDGRLFGAGRADASTPDYPRAHIVLFFLDPQNGVLTPFDIIDGYGHYSGVVEHDGQLWIACGNETQREAFEVFLLQRPLPA